ncbi:radical SAM/SPASM domain-containing protein [Streptomyces lavendulae]|uniref:radical SAM/SPASM domain-containing protein n=1 Tax=Streptomyces lavendulae TaxID=1914 RepID=UPI0033F8191E
MALRLSRYHVVSPVTVDEVDGQARRVVFATRSAEVRILDEAAWQMVVASPESLPENITGDLAGIRLLVDDHEDELHTVVKENQQAIDSSGCLSLVVTPTAQCQLGCGYCGQEHSARWLSPQHQDAFVRHVERKLAKRSYKYVDMCWFGAEPLVGMSVIRALSPRLRAAAERHSCSFGARVITNGLALSQRVARELVLEHGVVGIDITLDGPAEYHDTRRGTKAGKPTFQRVFANLVALAKTDLKVTVKLRINVDGSNWQGVSQLIRLLAEAGLQEKLVCYFAPIHSWGNEAHEMALPAERYAALEVEWYAELLLAGFKVGPVPSRTRIVCLAVQPEGVLVDAAGTLFNCTEAPYVPSYGEPNSMAIGNVVSGEIPGRRRALETFNDDVMQGKYNCASCTMLPVCGGACPKLWREGIAPCPSTLHNMPQRLLLALAANRTAHSANPRA